MSAIARGDLTELLFRIMEIMRGAKNRLEGMTDDGDIVHQGTGFGDLANDTEIRADRELGKFFMSELKQLRLIGQIQVEGMGDVVVTNPSAPCRATVDPLDGSLNRRMRCGSLGLPHTACLTVLDAQDHATFQDVLIGCVVDLRAGVDDTWYVERHEGRYWTTLRGRPAKTHPDTKLDLGKHIVIGEMYYPTNRERLDRAFSGEKGNLRNPGSAAYEMALVASGTAIAFICDRQKQHELGAAYALVKGAGGVAVDWQGKDLAERPYAFNLQTPVILAANQAIADQILERLRR